MKELMRITEEHRLPGNQLKPEAKLALSDDIREYIRLCGYVNVAEISRKVGLNRLIVRDMVNEILTEWIEDDKSQIASQLAWYESKLLELEIPMPGERRTDVVKLKSELMTKIAELRKLISKSSGDWIPKDAREDELYFHLFGKMAPATRQVIEQDPDINNDRTGETTDSNK